MKTLRANDCPASQPGPPPNVRALRGILTALAIAAFLCFCVVVALLPGLHQVTRTAQATAAYSCDKACACHRRSVVAASAAHGTQMPR